MLVLQCSKCKNTVTTQRTLHKHLVSLKGERHEVNIFLKILKIIIVLFERTPMVFNNFWLSFCEEHQKFWLDSMKSPFQ
jgi:hypothetical protein